jgi:hypothetical protein
MKKLLLSAFLVAVWSAGAWADVNVAAPFLQSGAGARSKGMGDSYLAVAEGPFGAFYNPAGLASVETTSLGFQHDGVEDLMRQEVLAGSFPLGPGGLYAGLEWIGYGSLDQLDTTGLATGSALTPTDLRLGLGYGLAVMPGLRAGATAGYYAEDLGSQKLSGLVLDLGTAWDWSGGGRRLPPLQPRLAGGCGGRNSPGPQHAERGPGRGMEGAGMAGSTRRL